jgi:aspartyl-tRNA(Asn)/glutamyl-tRNA(Gln) amidotransferase subunit B
MAELPRVMAQRFATEYGLSDYDATQLTQSLAQSAYFEAAAKESGQPKLASNWVNGEISRRLNAEEGSFNRVKVHPAELAALLSRIANGVISNNAAKQVFDELWSSVKLNATGGRDINVALGESVTISDEIDAIIEAKGLKQMNDTGALEGIVDEVIAANAKNVAEFKAGNEKALNALVGQIMKASKGKANPQQVNDLLRSKLAT